MILKALIDNLLSDIDYYKAIQEIDLNILQYNNKQIIKTEWIFKLEKKYIYKNGVFLRKSTIMPKTGRNILWLVIIIVIFEIS